MKKDIVWFLSSHPGHRLFSIEYLDLDYTKVMLETILNNNKFYSEISKFLNDWPYSSEIIEKEWLIEILAEELDKKITGVNEYKPILTILKEAPDFIIEIIDFKLLIDIESKKELDENKYNSLLLDVRFFYESILELTKNSPKEQRGEICLRLIHFIIIKILLSPINYDDKLDKLYRLSIVIEELLFVRVELYAQVLHEEGKIDYILDLSTLIESHFITEENFFSAIRFSRQKYWKYKSFHWRERQDEIRDYLLDKFNSVKMFIKAEELEFNSLYKDAFVLDDNMSEGTIRKTLNYMLRGKKPLKKIKSNIPYGFLKNLYKDIFEKIYKTYDADEIYEILDAIFLDVIKKEDFKKTFYASLPYYDKYKAFLSPPKKERKAKKILLKKE